MAILCDSQIRELIGIEPFENNTKRPGRVSYGVSSYGYDIRVGPVFKIFTNVNSQIIDPKRFSDRSFDAGDLAANLVGVLVALAVAMLLRPRLTHVEHKA